ncbi:MAG TPA: ChbG/HpnK family deacetylase, partial [Bacteroidia bacterium]|nr:ChbG/HpnK family deacetylase [Bacteroidia bacterium]
MKVVVNADDFGSTERHTRLILELLQNGKISSTTFLVNLPYSAEAAGLVLEKYPHLRDCIGLHFNLIEGKPLNQDLLDSPFVDSKNQLKDFRGRVSIFQQLFHVGKLATEINLQINRFHQLLGKYPSHIDSHGHTHCTFVMLLALLFARKAGKVGAIRLTRQYDHEPSQLAGMKNKLRRLAKHLLNL